MLYTQACSKPASGDLFFFSVAVAETNLCLELHTASLKENKEENAERVKNQKVVGFIFICSNFQIMNLNC